MSTGHGEKLTRKQEQAIVALLSHWTLEEAAESVGVSKATLWRWTQREDFRACYREARREAVNQAVARLQQVSSEAVDALHVVMVDPDAPAPARVSAAKVVLELAVKASEIQDLAERVKRLENVIHG